MEMSVGAAEVLAALPPDRRVGSVHVLDVDTVPDVNSFGEDAVRVLLTLAPPEGGKWGSGHMSELRQMIRRALVRAGEERVILFHIRPQPPSGAAEDIPPPRLGA